MLRNVWKYSLVDSFNQSDDIQFSTANIDNCNMNYKHKMLFHYEFISDGMKV